MKIKIDRRNLPTAERKRLNLIELVFLALLLIALTVSIITYTILAWHSALERTMMPLWWLLYCIIFIMIAIAIDDRYHDI